MTVGSQRMPLRVRHGAHAATGRRMSCDHGLEAGRLSWRLRRRRGPEMFCSCVHLIAYDRLRAVNTIYTLYTITIG
jgi:hypothetical protein